MPSLTQNTKAWLLAATFTAWIAAAWRLTAPNQDPWA